jgi:flagellar protein FliS
MNSPHIALRNYLATEVLTAAPQKLQLMLIEGALRFGQQARSLWRDGRNDEAGEAIIRCQQIVAQLLAGLKREDQAELSRQISGIYVFVLNSLIAAHLNRDEQKLADALSVLAEEQATWRAVCQVLGTQAVEAGEGRRLVLDA